MGQSLKSYYFVINCLLILRLFFETLYEIILAHVLIKCAEIVYVLNSEMPEFIHLIKHFFTEMCVRHSSTDTVNCK